MKDLILQFLNETYYDNLQTPRNGGKFLFEQ